MMDVRYAVAVILCAGAAVYILSPTEKWTWPVSLALYLIANLLIFVEEARSSKTRVQ